MAIDSNYYNKTDKKEWERRLEATRAIRAKYVKMSPLPISESSLLVGILKDISDLKRILEYLKEEKCYKKFIKKDATYLFYEINLKILNRVLHRIEEENRIYVGQILICSELKFNTATGVANYKNKSTNFKPDTDEYKLLRALMKKPNECLGYAEINQALGKVKETEKIREDISFIMRNIKSKLGIKTKSKKGNKNLFQPCMGYMIVCD